MTKIFLIIVFAPVLSICSLFYLQSQLVKLLHEQVNHTTFEALAILSRHRATKVPIRDYWDWKGQVINYGLNDDRRGFEVSRSTDVYLVEHDSGENCSFRSVPRFNGRYEHDHMFIPCSRAVMRTLHTGGFRGFSTNYQNIPVLSVGRPVRARGYDGEFTDIVLLVEINQSELFELIDGQEKAIKALTKVLAGVIFISALIACLFIYLIDKKRSKAENERDQALKKLRLAVDISSDDMEF